MLYKMLVIRILNSVLGGKLKFSFPVFSPEIQPLFGCHFSRMIPLQEETVTIIYDHETC